MTSGSVELRHSRLGTMFDHCLEDNGEIADIVRDNAQHCRDCRIDIKAVLFTVLSSGTNSRRLSSNRSREVSGRASHPANNSSSIAKLTLTIIPRSNDTSFPLGMVDYLACSVLLSRYIH